MSDDDIPALEIDGESPSELAVDAGSSHCASSLGIEIESDEAVMEQVCRPSQDEHFLADLSSESDESGTEMRTGSHLDLPGGLPQLEVIAGKHLATSFAKRFTWPHAILWLLQQRLGPNGLQASLLGRRMTVSTHFSGIGAAEKAMSMLQQVFHLFGLFAAPLVSVFACDCSPGTWPILFASLPGQCVFKNIKDLCPLPPSLSSGEVDFHQMRHAVLQSFRMSEMECARHGQACRPCHSDGNVSGSPCPPWSSSGLRRGRRDARTALLLIWMMWVLAAMPLWAIHENVKGFDTSLLEEFLGVHYLIFHIYTSPADVGFGFIRRPRIFSVILRRGAVVVLHDIVATYRGVCSALRSMQGRLAPAEIFFATEPALLREENAKRQSRKLPPLRECSLDWSYLLTDAQAGRIPDYTTLWQRCRQSRPEEDDKCIFDLSQNPLKRPAMSSATGSLPCLRHNGNILWSPKRRRWLLPVECGSLMGFPMADEFASVLGWPADENAYTMRQLGNAMHVANVGAVIAVTLACTRIAQ